jgi:hypothetical protein
METYQGPGEQSCLCLGEASLPYPKGGCGHKAEAVVFLFLRPSNLAGGHATSDTLCSVVADLFI